MQGMRMSSLDFAHLLWRGAIKTDCLGVAECRSPVGFKPTPNFQCAQHSS